MYNYLHKRRGVVCCPVNWSSVALTPNTNYGVGPVCEADTPWGPQSRESQVENARCVGDLIP